jgi:hypothetical protein
MKHIDKRWELSPPVRQRKAALDMVLLVSSYRAGSRVSVAKGDGFSVAIMKVVVLCKIGKDLSRIIRSDCKKKNRKIRKRLAGKEPIECGKGGEEGWWKGGREREAAK